MSDNVGEPLAGAPDAGPGAPFGDGIRVPNPHQGASYGRRLGAYRPTGLGPNSVVSLNGPELVRRSRDLRRNNPYARKAMDLLTNHVIGTGIKPRALCKNAKVRTGLMELWADWVQQADADQVLDFYGMQALAMSELVEGGEAFARMRTRRVSDGLPVPLQIQLLPTEQVPLSYNIDNGTNRVIQGIERDAIGARVAYWCYPEHPGDWYGRMQALSLIPNPVPAEDVCHMYNVARIGQLRGLPAIAAALTTVKQLGDYLDAELLRKQTAAMIVAFVKRAFADDVTPDEIAKSYGALMQQVGSELPLAALEPGTVQYLNPGEDVQFSSPGDVGTSFEPFVDTNLRAVAAATGVLYESLSGNWKNINDRTFRAAMISFKRSVEMWQWSICVAQFCQPIWLRFVSYAQLSGSIKIPKSVTPRDLCQVDWLPQRHEYINPVQDVQATGLAMGLGLVSRTAAVAERGDDVEVTDTQIAADKEREQKLGLAFSGLSTAGKVNLANVDQQETGEDAQETNSAPPGGADGDEGGAQPPEKAE